MPPIPDLPVVFRVVVEIDAAIDLGDMGRIHRALVGSPVAYALYKRAYGLTT